MALVSCRECNAEISDSAATCPRCGAVAPTGMAMLTFVRAGLTTRLLTVTLIVDQKAYGKVTGKGVVVPVAPGAHHVELLTMSLLQSTTATIEAKPGDTAIRVLTDFYGVPKIR